MFSSNPAKLFHVLLFFSVWLSCSCGAWSRAGESSDANSATFTAQQIETGIPFATREPEVFQTEIIVTNFNGEEKSERKTFLARAGLKRLTVFAAGEKSEISLLQTDEAKTFTLLPAKKIYKENRDNRAGAAAGETLQSFLTTEWLNAKTAAAFENLGAENGLTRFRARLNNSDAAEILLYVDENLQIPVRQEFYSRAEGGQRVLLYSVELKNFRPQADERLFALPPDYRKVSPEEFDKIVWQAKQ
jgi:hypothetical protein